jgi:hypothetical protein
MNTDYDLNLWSDGKGRLHLTAYEWQVFEENGEVVEIQTNSEKFHTALYVAPENIKEIEFLLGDLYVNQYPLTDYDSWIAFEDVVKDDCPPAIMDFLNSLPNYEFKRFPQEERGASKWLSPQTT